MESRRFIGSVLVAAFAVAAVGAYLYYRKSFTPAAPTSSKFTQDYATARFLHSQGQFDESIAQFSQVVQEAPTTSLATEVKLRLAYDLFSRNAGDDRIRAIGIYKDIIADEKLDPSLRATAYRNLGLSTQDYVTSDFVKKYIFNDGRYATFLAEAEGSLLRASNRLFEESEKLHPTALAKLEIARFFAVAITDKSLESQLTVSQKAERIEQYVKDSAPLMDAPYYSNSKKALIYQVRAIVLDASTDILENRPLQDIEANYKQAISIADALSGNDIYTKDVAMQSRLWYAMFLAHRFGASRLKDIKETLLPIISLDETKDPLTAKGIDGYLNNLSFRPTNSYSRIQLLAVARMIPEFKTLLIKNGWKI
ncbi:MAG: hypothetical protein HYT40_02875 [Candidatus Sungbacteria bacterium]|uniref:Tetratricopeptide repeat protein n=1 Tax=Candidatus Sungiibacteriota bacterium TaxID=2750080 RepID=A0A931SBW3_9BACT|nr:hypothetical protein [Candidatus Sungbacteria bacterium]